MRVRSNSRQCRQTRRGGFTIIELLIVIGIVMVLSALVLSGFGNAGSNSRRQSCQSNLAQIYQSSRLYQQDEGAFPFYNAPGSGIDIQVDGAPSGTLLKHNLGLWALYAFPKAGDPSMPDPAGPLGRYIRSAKVLHCPQDRDMPDLALKKENLIDSLDPTKFNVKYLSYQYVDDNDTPGNSSDDMLPYQSIRTTNPANPDWKRQLTAFTSANTKDRFYRQPADDTIVTWCPFHRPTGRNFDNVLFYDGSVQLILKDKDGKFGWQRTPKPPI